MMWTNLDLLPSDCFGNEAGRGDSGWCVTEKIFVLILILAFNRLSQHNIQAKGWKYKF